MFFLNFLFEAFENKYLVLTERILNALMFVIDLVINRYANVGATNQLQTWISPAPWAFSIWALIYSGLLAFIVYQLLPRSMNSKLINQGVHFYFVISTLLNAFWLLIWPMGNYCASFFVIFLLWQVLAFIYINIANASNDDVENDEEPQSTADRSDSERTPLLPKMNQSDYEYLIVFIPFSLYFAWVTCATVVSMFLTFLPISKSDPFQNIGLSILAILALMLMAMLFVFVQKDLLFGLVIVWALFGISQGSQIKTWPGHQANLVYYTSICTATILLLAIGVMMGLKIRSIYFNRSD